MQQCEDGDREAFHLFVFVKSHLLQGLSEDHVYRFDPPRPIDDDGERVDTKVKELVRKSNAAAVQKNSARGRAFFVGLMEAIPFCSNTNSSTLRCS